MGMKNRVRVGLTLVTLLLSTNLAPRYAVATQPAAILPAAPFDLTLLGQIGGPSYTVKVAGP